MILVMERQMSYYWLQVKLFLRKFAEQHTTLLPRSVVNVSIQIWGSLVQESYTQAAELTWVVFVSLGLKDPL